MLHINLALTPGAEDGVGPELMLKAVHQHDYEGHINYIWCGDASSLRLASKNSKIRLDFKNNQKALIENRTEITFLEDLPKTCLATRQASFLESSVRLALNNKIDALLTGPIDKAALVHLDQGEHHGQTEYLARHLALDHQKPFMAFLGGPCMFSLLTTHIPLAEVPKRITKEAIEQHLYSVAHHCSRLTGRPVSHINIKVLGLNPHAGENGLLGREEEDVLKPAIKEVNRSGLNIEGPLPPDGFFAYFHRLTKEQMPDAVVALYHDQGLIPYKLMSKGAAVNTTFGLTIPRTSPAHGTAVDIAGLGIACPLSTKKALEIAIELANKR